MKKHVVFIWLMSVFHLRAEVTKGSQFPTVITPKGKIQGLISRSRLGRPFYSFRGIRYAKAPIGELRFQPPDPIESWHDVYDATKDGAACPQPHEPDKDSEMQFREDCLFLNIYTSKLPEKGENLLQPVIVFYHAGSFHKGSGISVVQGPAYLMDQDIVLVVPNYRLGALGFLSTGDVHAPGNFGMKDQVLVLKWVKENALSFGGNPDSVTIAGCSAGSASVTAHMVSPMSKGFFHRVIAMSGSVFGQWPIPSNNFEQVMKLASLLNCPQDNSEEILSCLRSKTAEEITDTISNFQEFGTDPIIIWTPVIERDFGQPRFLPEHPIKLLEKGEFSNVPIMTGITHEEFSYAAYSVLENSSLVQEMNENFDRVAPIAFLYERETNHSKIISNELRKFYFGSQRIDQSSLIPLGQIYADGAVGFAVNRFAKLLATKNSAPIYFYKFNYRGRYSMFYVPNSNKKIGAVHHDDVIYLFYMKVLFPTFNETDPESPMVQKLTRLWFNFARTSNPTPQKEKELDNLKWEPLTKFNKKYLDIDLILCMSENMFLKRYEKWEELFPLSDYYEKQ